MTETEKMLGKFLGGLGRKRYREVFDVLESHGLCPLGKSNTATLLFQAQTKSGDTADIFAFRLGPPPVISFPKSYWTLRSRELNEHLSRFSYSEQPPIAGPVSDSQYSAGQIEMNRSTHERIIEVCTSICDSFGESVRQANV